MAQYRVLQGIDYPPNKRAEAGQVISDLPPQAIKWLLESGVIEDANKPAQPKEQPKVEAPIIEEPKTPEVEAVAEPEATEDSKEAEE